MSGTEKKIPPNPNTNSDDPITIASLKLEKGIKIYRSKLHLRSPCSTLSKKKDLARRKFIGKNAATKRKRNNYNGREVNGANKRRKKKKEKEVGSEINEPARLQRRTRYLLIKMKLDQNLIDAYSAQGWKGQSREKIRPEKELQKAKKQILECKLEIRDIVRQLDMLGSTGSIEHSLMNPDGSIHHEHIFCAKCKSSEAFLDNDIILCDGMCNSAFHQKCLDPPLDTENIPPEDQGWLCRYCDCRMEILEAVNAHLGTHFSMNNCWEDVFREEASLPDGGNALNPNDEWPSDDSEDIDYNPERRENSDADDGASESECSSYCYGASDESSDGEILCGRRQRRDVDYIKLHYEMFGKDATLYEQISEDEDWGPTKRKGKAKDSDAARTLMTLHETEKNSLENESGDAEKTEIRHDTQIRKSFFRIPRSAVERLREIFAENELPSRDVKESVSKELGLDPEKVSKWFKNARYLALKNRKAENENEVQGESGGVVMSKNATEAMVDMVGNFKNTNQRKRSNSWKMTSHRSPTKRSVKESTEVDDHMTMKERNKENKKRVGIGRDGFRDSEAELERLCKCKGRLESLKLRLVRFQNGKAKQKSNKLENMSVIYVPVAEVKEKA